MTTPRRQAPLFCGYGHENAPPSASLSLPIRICFAVWQWAGAQTSDIANLPVGSTAEVVNSLVRKKLERARALGAYQGTRTYRLEYHGFPSSRTAEMVVDVNYTAPGTKDFSIRSENGSKLLIDRVFKRMLQSEKEAATEENQRGVALNQDNYRFALVGRRKLRTVSSTFFRSSPGHKTSSYTAGESGSTPEILL